jgi:hypothetical protein
MGHSNQSALAATWSLEDTTNISSIMPASSPAQTIWSGFSSIVHAIRSTAQVTFPSTIEAKVPRPTVLKSGEPR